MSATSHLTFSAVDGVTVAYRTWGDDDGVPVLLHHGFAADSHTNWVVPGVVSALVAKGRRVVSVDARGHGLSEKPTDPEAYGHHAMSRDVSTLLDHLEVPQVDLVGYSMGGYVSLITAAREPRVRSVVLGGIGGRTLGDGTHMNREAVAGALEADDPKTIADPTARQFRRFADATGADRRALAAIMRAPWQPPAGVERINVPALVLVGENDTLAANAAELAEAVPGARLCVVPGDHLSAVAEPAFVEALLAFLGEVAITSA